MPLSREQIDKLAELDEMIRQLLDDDLDDGSISSIRLKPRKPLLPSSGVEKQEMQKLTLV